MGGNGTPLPGTPNHPHTPTQMLNQSMAAMNLGPGTGPATPGPPHPNQQVAGMWPHNDVHQGILNLFGYTKYFENIRYPKN